MSKAHVSYSHYTPLTGPESALEKRSISAARIAQRVADRVFSLTGAKAMYNPLNGFVTWFFQKPGGDMEGLWVEKPLHPDNTVRDLRAHERTIIKGIRDVSRGAARPPEPITLGVPNGKQQEPVVPCSDESAGGIPKRGQRRKASGVGVPEASDAADSSVNCDDPGGGTAVHGDGEHGARKPRGGRGRHTSGSNRRASGGVGGKQRGD